MSQYRDRIFKACTRPAMFFGVPMTPFLVITGAFLLVGMWVLYFINFYVTVLLIMVYVPLVIVMRKITRKDDQRLRQMLLRARMRVRHMASKRSWKAISYSPIRYKSRQS